ncbi:hypothetical protein P7C70_g9463, partial [Phenoliferia sp. Uapishka_3]
MTARCRVVSALKAAPTEDVEMSFAGEGTLELTRKQATLESPPGLGTFSSHSDADSEKLRAKILRWNAEAANLRQTHIPLPTITTTPATPIIPKTTTPFTPPNTPQKKAPTTDPRKKVDVPKFVNTTPATYSNAISTPPRLPTTPTSPTPPSLTASKPATPKGKGKSRLPPQKQPKPSMEVSKKTSGSETQAPRQETTSFATYGLPVDHWRAPHVPSSPNYHGSFTSTIEHPHPPRRSIDGRHTPYPPPRSHSDTNQSPLPRKFQHYAAGSFIPYPSSSPYSPTQDSRQQFARLTEASTFRNLIEEAKYAAEETRQADERRKFLASGTIIGRERNSDFYSTKAPTGPFVSSGTHDAGSTTMQTSTHRQTTNADNESFLHSSDLPKSAAYLVPSRVAAGQGSSEPFFPSTFDSIPNRTVTAMH